MKTLVVHFDVPDEEILLDTFIESARATEVAVRSLSKFYFGDAVYPELVVLPSEAGSLKQRIGVVVKLSGHGVMSALASVWLATQVMDSSTVQEVSRELTGRTPSEHLIEAIRALQNDRREPFSVGDDSVDESGQDPSPIEELLVESARGALEIERDDLDAINLPDDLRYDLEAAQAQLFGAALRDRDVEGVGFSDEHDFPIPRNQFAARAIQPVRRDDEDDDPEWAVEIEKLRLTSPNFDRNDQSMRKWKARMAEGNPILFEVDDEEFWQKLRSGEIEFAEATILEVQIAAQVNGRKSRAHRVLRVLKVNGVRLAEPLDASALAATLGKFKSISRSSDTPDLFD